MTKALIAWVERKLYLSAYIHVSKATGFPQERDMVTHGWRREEKLLDNGYLESKREDRSRIVFNARVWIIL